MRLPSYEVVGSKRSAVSCRAQHKHTVLAGRANDHAEPVTSRWGELMWRETQPIGRILALMTDISTEVQAP